MELSADPTAALPVDFAAYVAQREQRLAEHLIEGLPDYGFSLDIKLRRNFASIPPLRWAVRAAARSIEPVYQHLMMQEGVAVSPRQLPELHRMAERCAERLGIGVPRVFVKPDVRPNAWTLASDDVRPSIVLTSSLLRITAKDEMFAIIGHECGHIHNLHGAWQSLVVLLSNPLARGVLGGAARSGLGVGSMAYVEMLVGGALQLFLARWSRCAEVTCDRAGVVCSGSPDAMCRALVKLQVGDGGELGNIDIDEYLKQIPVTKSSLVRLRELGRSHPVTHKRIEAIRLFAESDVAASWLPGLPAGAPSRRLVEVDEECERLISVWDTSYRTHRQASREANP